MPFEGYSQDEYAQAMIDAYKRAGIPASEVRPQSFQLRDILYWLKAEPEFGRQALWLDNRDETDPGFDPEKPESWKPGMAELAALGLRTLAPPLWMLVRVGPNGTIVPSAYARAARAAGLDLITWSLERSGPLKDGGGVLLQIDPSADRPGRGHLRAPRRAVPRRRGEGGLLGLAGDGDVLCQLHGHRVRGAAPAKGAARTTIRRCTGRR